MACRAVGIMKTVQTSNELAGHRCLKFLLLLVSHLKRIKMAEQIQLVFGMGATDCYHLFQSCFNQPSFLELYVP